MFFWWAVFEVLFYLYSLIKWQTAERSIETWSCEFREGKISPRTEFPEDLLGYVSFSLEEERWSGIIQILRKWYSHPTI